MNHMPNNATIQLLCSYTITAQVTDCSGHRLFRSQTAQVTYGSSHRLLRSHTLSKQCRYQISAHTFTDICTPISVYTVQFSLQAWMHFTEYSKSNKCASSTKAEVTFWWISLESHWIMINVFFVFVFLFYLLCNFKPVEIATTTTTDYDFHIQYLNNTTERETCTHTQIGTGTQQDQDICNTARQTTEQDRQQSEPEATERDRPQSETDHRARQTKEWDRGRRKKVFMQVIKHTEFFNQNKHTAYASTSHEEGICLRVMGENMSDSMMTHWKILKLPPPPPPGLCASNLYGAQGAQSVHKNQFWLLDKTDIV